MDLVKLDGLVPPDDHQWRERIWRTRNGRSVSVKHMSDMHLLNAGKMLYRQLPRLFGPKRQLCLEWLVVFAYEMVFRGLQPSDIKPDTEVILEEETCLPM